ncbi:hypothetical protein [Bordetella pseudohinzii]|uniref:YcxB-like protein domain-containing protein n=1 Tax=Bordetella pseudohinzii TaxID=1331258 RepID=A0A0J6BZD4_9BORD|nr:hypothetical protein [Bordetella pseudohinzii]ANY18521.1 hypothetical protein BBN53_21095 [Bordetella pseudohinzii]KMM24078.1 hypothetical protein L540_08080 [Bordetella pseudohinzii]KXA77859.1 hypothetical protein AW878_14275 [Bordetella pseudohinzii]KXA78054.1 hypothetical protein AW877_12730 [Bordetella pseudohinzii]CUJ13567.1 Uncharacterised protein [Bordetella pseudohinzii]
MRWLIVSLYIAVTTGAIVLAIPVVLIALLVGALGGGLYMAAALVVILFYLLAVVCGRRLFERIFLRGINKKLAHLKAVNNFVPVLATMTADRMAFLGFDTSSDTGVFLSYPQREAQVFKLTDILGCNWQSDAKTGLLELTLKEGRVKIGIPREEFGDFKTRMFAVLGMNP